MTRRLTADKSDGQDCPEEMDVRDWMPKFNEVSDSIAALLWIRDIEGIFKIMNESGRVKCDYEDKAVLADTLPIWGRHTVKASGS
ncbi:hypothetical protein Tco_0716620 [Tanacetum coccineum]